MFKYVVVVPPSYVQVNRRLVRVLHFFNAKGRAVHIVVDVGQVGLGGSLSHTPELIVDGTVTQAHPALVGSDVRSGDAAQVSANCRDDEYLRGTGVRQDVDVLLIEMAGLGQSVRLSDLAESQTTHEDKLTVPRGLHNFAGRQLTNVDLLVRVSDIARPRNHLVVNDRHDRLDA